MCGLCTEKMELSYLLVHGNVKNNIINQSKVTM